MPIAIISWMMHAHLKSLIVKWFRRSQGETAGELSRKKRAMLRFGRFRIAIFLFVLVIFLALLIPITYREWYVTMTSKGTIFYGSYLDLDVSPLGFPIVGNWWSVHVYCVNLTSGRLTFQPSSNSTVLVTARENGETRTYSLQTDEKGEASFQYLPQFSDIRFQAFYAQYSPSQMVIVSSHFVPSNAVDNLLLLDLPSLLASIGIIFFLPKGKITKYVRWYFLGKCLAACAVGISAFVTFSAVYARGFLGTAWGYPENIIGNVVTFTALNVAFLTGLVLLVFSWIFTLIVKRANDEAN